MCAWHARHDALDTSNVSCRDVTWRAKWNLGFTIVCRVSVAAGFAGWMSYLVSVLLQYHTDIMRDSTQIKNTRSLPLLHVTFLFAAAIVAIFLAGTLSPVFHNYSVCKCISVRFSSGSYTYIHASAQQYHTIIQNEYKSKSVHILRPRQSRYLWPWLNRNMSSVDGRIVQTTLFYSAPKSWPESWPT